MTGQPAIRRSARAGQSSAEAKSAAGAKRRQTPTAAALKRAEIQLVQWFEAQGFVVQPFQRRVWRAHRRGASGLLHAPTGAGKTLAVFGAILIDALARTESAPAALVSKRTPAARGAKSAARRAPACLRVLWITPLRALATDTVRNLSEPARALGLPMRIASRTGDSNSRDRRRARLGADEVLVTTPESLALLLSYEDTAAAFAALDTVVVDEWHELLDHKRGVLLQLALARLRRLQPALKTWAMSATLGNLDEAMAVLVPGSQTAVLVGGGKPRGLVIETLLPEIDERFPWAGHLGLKQLPRVFARIQAAASTIVFVNTRSQAELWHQALSAVWTAAPETLALHHGSLDQKLRAQVELGLRDGLIRCVVATSSLDLGVDFQAVDQVIQISSPKGVARLLQRAGRSRHRPGEAGHVIGAPTHALEVLEFAAARRAIRLGRIEPRRPPVLTLDVLAQHVVSCALAGGFAADDLLAEVRGTHAFANLSDTAWATVLDFVVTGGAALSAYPDHHRVKRSVDGRYVVTDRRIAFRHRLSVGTITSDGSLEVRMLRGAMLGHVEEAFLARLSPGDTFLFAGRRLELVRLRDMTAYVRLSKSGRGEVPRWLGGKMPLSTELARTMTELLGDARASEPELKPIRPLLALQARISRIPQAGRLLVETVAMRDGFHVFAFPFAGRDVHEGMAAVIAARWSRRAPETFGWSVNDYGFVLSRRRRAAVDEALLRELLTVDELVEDIAASINMAELARRQFRDIARVAGLLPPSLPGRSVRSLRQLQASASLIFDVLRQHDPDHLMLLQAERQVLSQQLEVEVLRERLVQIAAEPIELVAARSLTPFSFPLWVERLRGSVSSEDWRSRVERVVRELEARWQ